METFDLYEHSSVINMVLRRAYLNYTSDQFKKLFPDIKSNPSLWIICEILEYRDEVHSSSVPGCIDQIRSTKETQFELLDVLGLLALNPTIKLALPSELSHSMASTFIDIEHDMSVYEEWSLSQSKRGRDIIDFSDLDKALFHQLFGYCTEPSELANFVNIKIDTYVTGEN